jgi:transposase
MSHITSTSWVAMDTAAEKIQVAIFRGSEATPSEEFEVSADSRGIGRLKKKLATEPGEVKCVYEAGPCGYGLYRSLKAAGYFCEVIAPSLIPRRPGERVKTNRLDAKRLGNYYRGGHLTPVRIPDEPQEALRDLLRARDDVRRNLLQARQRLNGCLLRHGYHFKDGNRWTRKHWAWIKAIQFSQEIVQMVVEEYVTAVETLMDQLNRFDQKIHEISQRPAYTRQVTAYSVLRGIQTLGAMTIIAEGGDLRQYAQARQFMGSIGIVPGEDSTGERQKRTPITKTGNAYLRRILIEAAWSYQRRTHAGATIRKRRQGQPETLLEIARRADHRLHGKFSKLQFRYNKKPAIANVAVARELAGFVWAIGQITEQ